MIRRLDQVAVYDEAHRVYLDAYHRPNRYMPEADELWQGIHKIIFIGVDHSDDWWKKQKLAEIKKGLRELDLIRSQDVRKLMVVLTHILESKVRRGRPSNRNVSQQERTEAVRMKRAGKSNREIAEYLYKTKDLKRSQIDNITNYLKRWGHTKS